MLARYGLIGYFGVLIFSNEYGWLKPDPRIFHHTLDELGVPPENAIHVGDTEDMDIAGARRPGCTRRATFRRATTTAPITSAADLLFFDWTEFYDLHPRPPARRPSLTISGQRPCGLTTRSPH